MSIENNGLNSDLNKRKIELSENEKKLELKRQLDFKSKKEKIVVEIETENEIFHLKELVERGVITNEIAEKIVSGNEISNEEVVKIFDKINQIEEIKDVDKYLPKELRVTQEQYLQAVTDDIFRIQLLTKIDSALTILSRQILPDSTMGLNLFSGFIGILDKNLILIQENTIDIKIGLKKVDEQKSTKQNIKLSFWQKIINFIKELFN